MPTLDSCITDVFSPLNTTGSAGITPVKPAMGSFRDPENYDPDDPTLVYSLDHTKFWNAYWFQMGFA